MGCLREDETEDKTEGGGKGPSFFFFFAFSPECKPKNLGKTLTYH